MKTVSFFPWPSAMIWSTIIASVVIVGAAIFLWYRNPFPDPILKYVNYGLISLLVVAMLAGVVMMPRKVVVDTDAIDVHMLCAKVHIPAEEVVAVKHYPNGIDSHRIAGMGGFFGNVGLFTSAQCGRHFSLVTNPQDVCVIIRKNHKPVVVSVKDNNVFAIYNVTEQ